MNALEKILQQNIKTHGPMDLLSFMTLALYHPHYGYYATQNVIGHAGDFITAPEMTQVFGEILACWFMDQWYQQGKKEPIILMELGPGRGTLMLDMMRIFSKHPAFYKKFDKVILVEKSPVLRAIQKEHLSSYLDKISFLNSLEEYISEAHHEETVFIVANEFFDALPIQQYINGDCRKIGLNEKEQFIFLDHAQPSEIQECCPMYPLIMKPLCDLIEKQGAALIIDYGFLKEDSRVDTWGDTLQALSKHRYANVLENPGQQDLSHHVNFHHLKTHVNPHLNVHVMPQGAFLKQHGMEERTAHLAAQTKDTKQRNDMLLATARLTMPQHMGNLFKVMEITP